jgi:pimeloyl-ACP methyl ester carboxylesterase
MTPWQRLDFMRESRGPLNLATNQRDRSETILFLHGVTRNWRSYYPLLPELNADYRLAALDFRGHGHSESRHAYFVADYVDDALAAIDQLEAQKLIVYGHSLGAMVALAAAAKAPDRVHRLILEDPPFSTMGARLPSLPLNRYFLGLREMIASKPASLYDAFSDIIVGEDADGSPIRVKHQRDELSRRFAAESLAVLDPAVLEPIVTGHWLDGYDFETLAREVTCPITLLQADATQGGMLTDSDAERLTMSRRVRFPGVGHSIHWARPLDILAQINAGRETRSS